MDVNKAFEDAAERRTGRRHRDPERIKRMLEILRSRWEANPDMRLGQLIGNVFRTARIGEYSGIEKTGLMSIEDDEFEEALKRWTF